MCNLTESAIQKYLNNSNSIKNVLYYDGNRSESIVFFSDNDSIIVCPEHAPTFTKSALFRVCFLVVLAIISLIGNLATMWNIKKSVTSRGLTRHSWSAIYYLIFHLSIADLLVTMFCIFGEAGWSYTVDWRSGELSCKLVKFFQMFSLYLSTYVLVLIGVDRWIAVKYPMKSLSMAKRCHRLIGLVYALSFTLSLPQVFIILIFISKLLIQLKMIYAQLLFTLNLKKLFLLLLLV